MNLLPSLYHIHHTRHTEDLALWMELARLSDGLILELGCGTGRVLVPLLQAGYPAIGLDLDRAMLAHLQAHLPPDLSSPALLVQADMTGYAFACRFGLILLPCNTFSTLPAESRLRLLELARRHLAPGGSLAISIPNPAVMRRMPPTGEPEVEEIFPHPEDGEPVQVSSSWRRAGGKFHLTWQYDHLLADGRVERISLNASHDLAPFEFYQAQIEQAGLRLSAAWGNYDASPYTPQSDHLILLVSPPVF